jgi:ribosomal protein S2
MFAAIGKFWSALFTLFDTVERASNSLNELTKIAEEESRGLKDKMKVERDDRQAKLNKQLSAD